MIAGIILYVVSVSFCLGCAWLARREDLVAALREEWAS